jgi:SAM-dependent methyltransferase
MFQEQGWDVYGVEMGPAAVARARDRVGDRIHTGTLESAPFAEESFDVILFSHSLEHLFSLADTLAHARRLLKPEGMIVVTVPNVGSVEARFFG